MAIAKTLLNALGLLLTFAGVWIVLRNSPINEHVGAGDHLQNLEGTAAFNVSRENIAAADNADSDFSFHEPEPPGCDSSFQPP